MGNTAYAPRFTKITFTDEEIARLVTMFNGTCNKWDDVDISIKRKLEQSKKEFYR